MLNPSTCLSWLEGSLQLWCTRSVCWDKRIPLIVCVWACRVGLLTAVHRLRLLGSAAPNDVLVHVGSACVSYFVHCYSCVISTVLCNSNMSLACDDLSRFVFCTLWQPGGPIKPSRLPRQRECHVHVTVWCKEPCDVVSKSCPTNPDMHIKQTVRRGELCRHR